MVFGQIGGGNRAAKVNAGEYHFSFYPNYVEEIEVIEDTPIYGKIQ
jgi:hypothetical protein